MGFAKKQLDKRAVITENVGFTFPEAADEAITKIRKSFEIDEHVEIEAHGEISNQCVNRFAQFVGTEVGSRYLIIDGEGFLEFLDVNPGERKDRIFINPNTTELLPGKDKYIKKHSYRLPKNRRLPK